MSELGNQARALIADADGVDSPSATDKERVRRRLGLAAVAMAATSAGAATGATAKFGGAMLGGGGLVFAAKLIAGAVVIAAITAGAAALNRDSTRALPTVNADPAAPPTSGDHAPSAGAGGAPEATGDRLHGVAVADRPASPAAATQPRPATTHLFGNAAPPAKRSPASAPGGAEPVTALNAAPQAGGEVALLRKAEAANEAGDGIAALEALDTHAKRYPEGVLADQREVERVVALCTIARAPAARQAGERFLEAHPRSSRAERVRRSCGLP